MDLLKHIDDSHVMKRLSKSVAEATSLPESAVFLCGMGIFSTLSCRQFDVENYSVTVPTGLYVAIEHPVEASRLECVNSFRNSIFEVIRPVINELYIQLDSATKRADRTAIQQQIDTAMSFYADGATGASLDKTLLSSGGYFAAISEGNGFKNLIVKDNSALQAGFTGLLSGSARSSRPYYSGHVIGGVSLFTDAGTIQAIHDNASHLEEKFIKVSLSRRYGASKASKVPTELMHDYTAKCQQFYYGIANPMHHYFRHTMTISSSGSDMLESAFLGDDSNTIKAMKLAANLHLLDSDPGDLCIADKHVESAVAIIDIIPPIDTVNDVYAISDMFDYKNGPISKQEIVHARGKGRAVKTIEALERLVKGGILSKCGNQYWFKS